MIIQINLKVKIYLNFITFYILSDILGFPPPRPAAGHISPLPGHIGRLSARPGCQQIVRETVSASGPSADRPGDPQRVQAVSRSSGRSSARPGCQQIVRETVSASGPSADRPGDCQRVQAVSRSSRRLSARPDRQQIVREILSASKKLAVIRHIKEMKNSSDKNVLIL